MFDHFAANKTAETLQAKATQMQTQFQINVPTAIHFGAGASKALTSLLPQEAERVLLVRGASGRVSYPILKDLQSHGVTVDEISVAHEPTIDSVNAAFQQVAGGPFSVIVACGGGSVLDAAKAIRVCLELGMQLPHDLANVDPHVLSQDAILRLIAIPTTAGTGAEVTSNAVLGTSTSKVSLRGRRLFPTVALVDPELLSTAPKATILGAGLDALTQTIEAYTSVRASPFTQAITKPNLVPAAKALRDCVNGGHPEAHTQLSWTSLSSGLALANGGLGAAHGLASVLGGQFDAPHGLLCGRLLGPVLRQNLARATLGSDTLARIEDCIEALCHEFTPADPDDDLSGFEAWLEAQNVPRLRAFIPETSMIDGLAEASVRASSSQKNAVPLQKSDFKDILIAAF